MSKKISFTFSGWVENAEIEKVTEVATGKDVDITQVDNETILKNFESGKWAIGFVDAYENSNKTDCDMTDFQLEDE